jgi:L-rhamnose mutarotase
MARYGLTYKVKKEAIGDYEKAHADIWPEMNLAISKAGFRNYSIFAMKDGTMFAYLEHDNLDEGLKLLYETEVSKRWQEYMNEFFEKQKYEQEGPEYIYLKEVYHLD